MIACGRPSGSARGRSRHRGGGSGAAPAPDAPLRPSVLFFLEPVRCESQRAAIFLERAPHIGGDAAGEGRLDFHRYPDLAAGEGRQVLQNLLGQPPHVAAGPVGVDLHIAVEAAKRRGRRCGRRRAQLGPAAGGLRDRGIPARPPRRRVGRRPFRLDLRPRGFGPDRNARLVDARRGDGSAELQPFVAPIRRCAVGVAETRAVRRAGPHRIEQNRLVAQPRQIANCRISCSSPSVAPPSAARKTGMLR